MNFKEYQEKARNTAVYPSDSEIIYPILGLAGETGEVCEKLKKQIRDKEGDLDDPIFLKAIGAELGDIIWYISNLASDLRLDLDQIAQHNLDKLASRKERGVLGGSGDSR